MKLRQVAGGLIFKKEGLLLVRNDRHYSKTSDWTTPGGVIDRGETILEGLTREVLEETGLIVDGWQGPIYDVKVNFVDRGFTLGVKTFLAEAWQGEITLEDPDKIVTDAAFFPMETQINLLSLSPVWVREPLLEWQEKRQKNERADYVLEFEYEVLGKDFKDSRVSRKNKAEK